MPNFEFRTGRRWRVIASGIKGDWRVSLFDCQYLTGHSKPLKVFKGTDQEISALLQEALDFSERYEAQESLPAGCQACTGSPRAPKDCVVCDVGL